MRKPRRSDFIYKLKIIQEDEIVHAVGLLRCGTNSRIMDSAVL